MAKHSQHQQETSASNRSGGGQAVVELCSVTTSGLIFWSRQRFEIGSELQIRIRRDALPPSSQASYPEESDELVTVCGFVVECPSIRKPDGAYGFQVSLLLESALTQPTPKKIAPRPLRYVQTRIRGLVRPGLN